ncbi:MAG: hypothetical protein Q9227_005395 [Pyrenula ochraceoflavens]
MAGMVYLQPFNGEHGSGHTADGYYYPSYEAPSLGDETSDRALQMQKHLETLEKSANGFNGHLMLEVPQGFSRLHLDSPWETEAFSHLDRTVRYVSPSGPYGGDLTTASDSPSSPTEDWSPQLQFSQVGSHPNNVRSPHEWTPCSNELPFLGQNLWTPEHSRLTDIGQAQPAPYSGTAVTPRDIQRYPDPTPDAPLEDSAASRLPPQPQHLRLSTDQPIDASDSEYDVPSSHDTASDGGDPDYSPNSRRRSSMPSSKHPQARSPTNARRTLPRRNTSTTESYRVSKSSSVAANKSKSKAAKKKSRNVAAMSPLESKAPRPFACPFARYGCLSTFSAKNEWKRHVSSQHLQLGFYRCDIGACNPSLSHSSISHSRQHNDFNRKDLFTQHLRRMHTPWSSSKPPNVRAREDFEKSLDAIRERCWVKRRGPPMRSVCTGCDQLFEGDGSWEERMEHVGRHIEKGTATGVEREDEGLRDWAIDVGVIREVSYGVYRLWGLRGDDRFVAGEEDAEGESE